MSDQRGYTTCATLYPANWLSTHNDKMIAEKSAMVSLVVPADCERPAHAIFVYDIVCSMQNNTLHISNHEKLRQIAARLSTGITSVTSRPPKRCSVRRLRCVDYYKR